MIVFNHSGNIGDVLYSLNFAREFAAANGEGRFGINLQKDVPLDLQHDHPCGKLLMDDAAEAKAAMAEFGPKLTHEQYEALVAEFK